MKRYLCLVSLLLSASLFIACEKEISSPDEGNGTHGSTVVGFSMAGDNTVTKSSTSALQSSFRIVADLSEETGINGLILSEEITSMDAEAGTVTKGTPVYTENFSEVYSDELTPIGVFATTDWTDKAADLAKAFEKKGNSWTYEYHYDGWPDDNKLTYFFAAPSSLPDYIGKPSFTQDGRAITFSLVSANYPTTAVDQKDVLFTSKDIEIKRGGTSTNDVLFYHVFTAVKFKVGNTDNRFHIVGVDLSNMYTSGTCTVTPNYNGASVTTSNPLDDSNAATKSASCSVWIHPEATVSRATFSQTYEGTIDYTFDNSNFANSFYNGTTDKKNLIATEGDTKATATFMCVPMPFSDDDTDKVILTIHYVDDNDTSGLEKTATVDLSTALDGKEWKAGQLYTYALTVNGLTVSVEDVTENGTMNNVVIKNTGNMDGYIRATITANWVKAMKFSDDITRNVIVAPWSRNGELPNFVKLNNDSWLKDGDCFYYYKNPVQGTYATNVPLFESYSIHDIPEVSNGAPIPGCFLELTVSAQIIPAYTSKTGDAVKTAVVTAWDPNTDAVVSKLATVAETPTSK